MSEVPRSEEFYRDELHRLGESDFRAAYAHSFFEIAGESAAFAGTATRYYVPIKGGKSLASIGGKLKVSDVCLPFPDLARTQAMILKKESKEYLIDHHGAYLDGIVVEHAKTFLLSDGAKVAFSQECAPYVTYCSLDRVIAQLSEKPTDPSRSLAA